MNKFNIKHITGGSHKIHIPFEVELKIRALCQHNQDREWSGVLFYKPTGSFNSTLTINCVDICPMDIGTSTYTEFDMAPEVVSYMAENDLLDCEMGLIHSHDRMGTFFSGTDQATLQEEGSDRNVFVSLIVNNEGKYTAGITRKVNYKSVKTCITHTDFNDTETLVDADAAEEIITEVEWYDLAVESPFEAISSEMKTWTDGILAKKASKVSMATKSNFDFKKPAYASSAYGGYPYNKGYYAMEDDDSELFAEERATWGGASSMRCGADIAPLNTRVAEAVARIITGNLIADMKDGYKAKLKQWVSTKMVQQYDKILADDDAQQYFRQICDIVISYYLPELYDATDPTVEEHIVKMLDDELRSYPKNKYIKELMEVILEY